MKETLKKTTICFLVGMLGAHHSGAIARISEVHISSIVTPTVNVVLPGFTAQNSADVRSQQNVEIHDTVESKFLHQNI